MRKTLLVASVILATLVMVPSAYAQGNGNGNGGSNSGGVPFVAIQEQLDAILQQLGSLGDVQAQLDALQGQLGALSGDVDALDAGLAGLSADLDGLSVGGGLVPYKVEVPGGICNTAGVNSANPEIVIDSSGSDSFVVTSILVRTGPQGLGAEGYTFLSINSVTIDEGVKFDTRTGNLMAPVDGWGVNEAADLMGTPIRRTSVAIDAQKGGNFPHQIVAEGAGTNDIRVRLFCRADDYDLSLDEVVVAGWKPADDTVAVTYLPGS